MESAGKTCTSADTVFSDQIRPSLELWPHEVRQLSPESEYFVLNLMTLVALATIATIIGFECTVIESDEKKFRSE